MKENHIMTRLSERIEVVQGDITAQQVDAIVNAANNSLLGGGGVDGAIHRAAGPKLLEECRGLNGCATGEAKITKGYQLSAKWVIHTVGPVWHGGADNEDSLLASCYRCCFALAIARRIGTMAFPSISTGAYRFPLERAAAIAVKEAAQALSLCADLKKVVFVCFDQRTFECYRQALAKGISDNERGQE